MCRNIKKLRFPDRTPTDDELRLASLQFVRKVSGHHAPSRANQHAFDAAVEDVTAAMRSMFDKFGARLMRPSVEKSLDAAS